jgi:putative membrane protein
VTLYLFSLPFNLISDLGWATIPIVTMVAFTFMGIEGIADEIEMPFGATFGVLSLFTRILRLWQDMTLAIFH